MENIFPGIISALWFGVLTSISPCPLATNIAAMSYIGKQAGNAKNVFATGMLYAAGRMLSYVILSVIIVASVLSIEMLANFFQKYMNKILGPVLILAGMFLLDLLSFSKGGFSDSDKLRRIAGGNSYIGPVLLGILFALSFCPVSAALFFGSLIPLSIKYKSMFLLPSIYGAGTALPVFIFAALISMGAQYVGKIFDKITIIERWARRTTGVIFIVVGIYYTLTFIFNIQLF
jgi:cytochrome c-type biogenesis protein